MEKDNMEIGEDKVEEPKNTINDLSKEQLIELVGKLEMSNRQMYSSLKNQDISNTFKRLDFLYKTVELSKEIKDAEFINYCINEIKELMIIKQEGE